MTARIQNAVQPDVTTGVQHLFKAVYAGGVPQATLELVHLRASQVNGCSACVHAGVTSAAKASESAERRWDQLPDPARERGPGQQSPAEPRILPTIPSPTAAMADRPTGRRAAHRDRELPSLL